MNRSVVYLRVELREDDHIHILSTVEGDVRGGEHGRDAARLLLALTSAVADAGDLVLKAARLIGKGHELVQPIRLEQEHAP